MKRGLLSIDKQIDLGLLWMRHEAEIDEERMQARRRRWLGTVDRRPARPIKATLACYDRPEVKGVRDRLNG